MPKEIKLRLRTPLPGGSSLCEGMGEGCCTQPYTYTSHRHPAFLCYIDLYVTIESGDIIHNVTIPPKVLMMTCVQIIIETTKSIKLG